MSRLSFRVSLFLVFCCAALIASSEPAMGGVEKMGLDISPVAEQAEILQFKAGGHVLGFSSNKVYMVDHGHALMVCKTDR